MSEKSYWILLSTSTGILSIISVFAFQQFCNTDVDDKVRLHKTAWVVFVSSIGIILNVLIYSKYMYPKVVLIVGLNVQSISIIFEAFSMIITFHVLMLLVLSIMDKFHNELNVETPKYMKYLLYTMQIFIIIMVLICYSFAYIFANIVWMHIFHMTLAVVILTEAIFIFRRLLKLLKILNKVRFESINNNKIRSAKRGIIIAIIVAIFLSLVSTAAIVMTITILSQGKHSTVNLTLNNCIMHSLFIILIKIGLLLWVYRKYKCCEIDINSVCMMYGCGDFWAFMCSCFCIDDLDALNRMDSRERMINQMWHNIGVENKNDKLLQVQLLDDTSDIRNNENGNGIVEDEDEPISSITHNISDNKNNGLCKS